MRQIHPLLVRLAALAGLIFPAVLPSQETPAPPPRDGKDSRGAETPRAETPRAETPRAESGLKDDKPAVKEAPGERAGPPFQEGGPGGPPRRFGPGRGGPVMQDRKLVAAFDKDGDGRLNKEERQAARDDMRKEREADGRRGFGPPGRGRGDGRQPPQPGPKVSPADVKSYPDAGLYAPGVLRTFFLDFENADWEKELADFSRTDVDVPAVLTVDGRRYEGVGVHFRGSSSLMMVGEGWKRSLNLSLDHADPNQRLHGQKTLEFLNAHGDPTFTRSFLYYHVARHYLPASRANYVKVVINGESWGVYVNQEPVNKDFLKEWFGTREGVRWKVGVSGGDPRGRRAFSYLGDRPEEYKRQYEVETKDGDKAWPDLIKLCRTLNQTPAESLEEALRPLLDIDRALWFLALDSVLTNNDGYWVRTGDYNLYQDQHGRFHVFPHDANETFKQPSGPGFGFGRPGESAAVERATVELDPLFGAQDPDMPLFSRLLAAPGLRARYLAHVRTIAEEWLDWGKLEPVVAKLQKLIAEEVRSDTRKLESFAAFEKGVVEGYEDESFRGPRRTSSLKMFVDERRKYLLGHPEVMKPAPRIAALSLEVLRHGSVLPGDPTSEEPVRVVVAAAAEPPAEQVLLYYAAGKEASFQRVEMTRTEEGRYAGSIPALPAGTAVRYYVEARSPGSGTAAFLPAGAELGALTYKVKRE